ncbi:MAG TPA: MFS transporter, partial [Actinopolymorphaceae bacterium]
MPSSSTLRSVPRDILALAGVAFSVALGFGILTPAIPLFTQAFGVGTTAAGAVVSAFALMRLVFGPFGGRLVDRLGERTTLVGGLAVVAVSALLAGLSQNYPQLLILRAIGGIGSTAFTVAATALVIRVAVPESRGRAMSIYQSGFVIGGIVGPAVGGAVLGISFRAPFFLYAGSLGLACVVGLLFLSGVPARDAGGGGGGVEADGDSGASMKLSEALA